MGNLKKKESKKFLINLEDDVLNLANLESASKILSNPTWDVLVLLFFLVAGFFYGLMAGKKKILAVLFSIYISIILMDNFGYLDFFTQGENIFTVFLVRAIAFFTLIFILAVLFAKTIFRGKPKKEKWWQVFVLSFLEVGLLMSAAFQLLPAKDLFTFSPAVQTFFASGEVFFWWLTLPLVALFFILRKRKEE